MFLSPPTFNYRRDTLRAIAAPGDPTVLHADRLSRDPPRDRRRRRISQVDLDRQRRHSSQSLGAGPKPS